MICPVCGVKMETRIFYGKEVNMCANSECLGYHPEYRHLYKTNAIAGENNNRGVR